MLARQYRMPAVDLARFEVDTRLLKLIPAELASKHTVLPLKRDGRQLTVAIADPTSMGVVDDLKFITRYDIVAGARRRVLDARGHREALRGQRSPDAVAAAGHRRRTKTTSRCSRPRTTSTTPTRWPRRSTRRRSSSSSTRSSTNAVNKGASDIHFECFEHELRVRYRIDGALHRSDEAAHEDARGADLALQDHGALNIAERRVPQDGRIKLKVGKKVIDFRVSSLPTLFGEKIVLRILDKGNLTLDLEKFGIEPRAERELMEAISNPYGMVLVTGPTGSGKTTTLYSALSKINNGDVEHHDRRGSGRVQPVRHQPGAGAHRDRHDVRGGAEGVPAAGPERHHGRRDPRPRDRRHRHQGRAHGPHGA